MSDIESHWQILKGFQCSSGCFGLPWPMCSELSPRIPSMPPYLCCQDTCLSIPKKSGQTIVAAACRRAPSFFFDGSKIAHIDSPGPSEAAVQQTLWGEGAGVFYVAQPPGAQAPLRRAPSVCEPRRGMVRRAAAEVQTLNCFWVVLQRVVALVCVFIYIYKV